MVLTPSAKIKEISNEQLIKEKKTLLKLNIENKCVRGVLGQTI